MCGALEGVEKLGQNNGFVGWYCEQLGVACLKTLPTSFWSVPPQCVMPAATQSCWEPPASEHLDWLLYS